MREQKRRRLFLFDAADYRAAEAWLNEQAGQGWELEGIWPGPYAVFKPTRRRDLRYAVTLDPSRGDGAREDAYLQLMEDGGWKRVEQKPGLFIFASIPGARPAPLRTDPELERRQLFRHVRRGWIASIVVLAVLAALLLLAAFLTDGEYMPLISYETVLKDERVVALLAAPLLAAALVWETVVLLRLWRAGKRTAEGGGELPALRGPRARKLLLLLVSVLLLASAVMGIVQSARQESVRFTDGEAAVVQAAETSPVLRGGDLGQGDGKPLSLRKEPGLLVDRITYSEVESGRTMITDRFDCRTAALARWFAGDMVRAEVQVGIAGYDRLDGPVLEPADLGFDQSWTCAGEGWSQVLIQDGNVVAVVNGPIDLTDPTLPDILRDRLRLE